MMPCSLIELLDVHISDQGEGLLKSTVVNWLTQEQGGAAQATDMDDCSSTFLNKPIHVILGKCIPHVYPLDTVSDRSFTSCQYSVWQCQVTLQGIWFWVTSLVLKPRLLTIGGDKLFWSRSESLRTYSEQHRRFAHVPILQGSRIIWGRKLWNSYGGGAVWRGMVLVLEQPRTYDNLRKQGWIIWKRSYSISQQGSAIDIAAGVMADCHTDIFLARIGSQISLEMLLLGQHKPASTGDDDDNGTTTYCDIVACTLAAICLVLLQRTKCEQLLL